MCKYLTTPRFVNFPETIVKVACSSRKIRVQPIKIREVFRERRNSKLLLEDINFIQKENNRLVLEPLTVDHRVEEHYFFLCLLLG